MARNGRSSLPRSRRILEKCRSSLPRSRRMLDGCRSSLPRSRRMLDGCRSSLPGIAECSTGAARATPEAQNARRVPLVPAQEPQHARKVPLEPTAVRCVRFLRSKWPLEKCRLLFVFYRHQLLLGATLLRACYAQVFIYTDNIFCWSPIHFGAPGAGHHNKGYMAILTWILLVQISIFWCSYIPFFLLENMP